MGHIMYSMVCGFLFSFFSVGGGEEIYFGFLFFGGSIFVGVFEGLGG